MTADRTYWHVPGRPERAWHARGKAWCDALCGVHSARMDQTTADRLPPHAHLCGNCGRIIAARTDAEAASPPVALRFRTAAEITGMTPTDSGEQWAEEG